VKIKGFSRRKGNLGTLSVLIITKDEEKNIQECLESVTWADEIVVVDSGSRDRTVEIAKAYTPKVFSAEWRGYAETKRWALDKVTGEWILWLDADERVTPELAREIREAIRNDRGIEGFYIPRKAFFLGRWIRHGGWYPGYVLRLIRREKAHFSHSLVHEYLDFQGRAARLHSPLLHHTDPTIEHYFEKFNRYTSLAAQELWERGRRFRLVDLIFRPIHMVLKMYVFKRGFLDGFQGFLLAILSGTYVFVKYAKLWELEKRQGSGRGEGS